MTDIKVRDALIEDIPAILDIINYEILNSTSIYDYNPQTLEQRINWFENQLLQNMPIIVAVLNKEIIGYGAFNLFRPKEGYKYCVEHAVYVHHEKRNNGAGKLLLAKLIELAVSMNIHSMIAGIDGENLGSIEFHKKFGFVEVARLKETGYKFERWLDLVFMQLFLNKNENQQ